MVVGRVDNQAMKIVKYQGACTCPPPVRGGRHPCCWWYLRPFKDWTKIPDSHLSTNASPEREPRTLHTQLNKFFKPLNTAHGFYLNAATAHYDLFVHNYTCMLKYFQWWFFRGRPAPSIPQPYFVLPSDDIPIPKSQNVLSLPAQALKTYSILRMQQKI